MSTSRITLTLVLGFALGLGLAACNDNDRDASITTVAKGEIRDNTNETSEPIVINDLSLSGRDTQDNTSPAAI